MQNRATVCRGCNVRLIPAFVECDGGGGKGGAESSCLPAEPTNTGSRQLPRRPAIVLDGECGGPSPRRGGREERRGQGKTEGMEMGAAGGEQHFIFSIEGAGWEGPI